MENVSKAAYDSIIGANTAREDLSSAITMTTERPRPVSQFSEQVTAKNLTHQWNEQSRNQPFTGATSYPQGVLPATNTKAPARFNNVTCRQGLTASVTDEAAQEWTGAGSWQLADGEQVRLMQDAIDLETELAMLDVMDDMEIMHIVGNRANPQAFAGGQTDGLITWIQAGGGQVVATGGSSSAPTPFLESFLKTGARSASETYPGMMADTLLVPPELIPDINGTVGGGANRPIVQLAQTGPNGTTGLTGGNRVLYYETGFSTLKVVIEPALSPLYNPAISQCAAIGYAQGRVKTANLIPMKAELLARIGPSVQKMVTTTWAQEHRSAGHAFLIPNVKSAV